MIKLNAAVMVAITITLLFLPAYASADPGQTGPYTVDLVTTELSNPASGSDLTVYIYYPSQEGNVDTKEAPYPAVVFAPGFLSPRGTYEGNATHLASWGYIVATIPDFPPVPTEDLVSDIRFLLDHFEDENADTNSIFYNTIDEDRFGLVGHSRGGMSALTATAQDTRVKTVVALDPAGLWDPEEWVPKISVPLAIIAAPAQTCNLNGSYQEMYEMATAAHRAQYVLAEASHCDFMDTDDVLKQVGCVLACGGSYDKDRVNMVEHYTTAWLNYYLQPDANYFTYLYGTEADQDVDDGLITREAHTLPLGFTAISQTNAIVLSWQQTNYPVIVGTDIFRSLTSGDYPEVPIAQVGSVPVYADTDVQPSQEYFYIIRSRDAAGNLHMASEETQAKTSGQAQNLYLPMYLSPFGSHLSIHNDR